VTLLLALAAAAAIGCGLISLAFGERSSSAHRVVLGLGFGFAISSAVWAAALLLGFTSAGARLGKDVALLLAGLGLLVRARRNSAPRPLAVRGSPSDAASALSSRRPSPADGAVDAPPAAPRGLALAFAGACAVAVALFAEHTARFPDGGWDAWMIWNLRARFLYRAGPAGSAVFAAFSPDLVFWAHQDYPWLVPGLVAQGFFAAGSESPIIPALIAAAFAALAVSLLVLTLRELRGTAWGLLGGLVLASTPCLIAFTANQQSDVPLGAVLLLGTSTLAIALERDDARLFALAGAGASLAAWTKNEGALYLLALVAALLLHGERRRVGRFLLGTAPVIALFAGFKLFVAHANDLTRSSETALQRLFSLQRWGELGLASLRRLVYFQNWALWLPAFLVALWLLPRPWRKSTRVLLTALGLALAALYPVFILQPHPLLWFFRTAIDRLLIQLWPTAVLAVLLSLAKAKATART
jgi:4-amino-4-deoxy-L-arabinose transferase-like glycosyltransferase